jgi:hypothetical protein
VLFPYKRYSDAFTRPVIPVRVAAADRWIDYEVLVDSGADICIFDVELAEDLGLDLHTGHPAIITGATGSPQDVFIHPVELSIAHHTFGARVAFMPTANPYGLAGQRGFFSQLRITFDQPGGQVELQRHSDGVT